MKFIILISSLFFILNCALTEKSDFQSVLPNSKVQEKRRFLDDLRNLAQTSTAVTQENFQFISSKLKNSLNQYKILKKKVLQIETRLNELLLQSRQPQQESKDIRLESITLDIDDSLIDDLKEEIFNSKQEEVSFVSPQPTSVSPEIIKDALIKAKEFYNKKNWNGAIEKFEEYRRVKSKQSTGYRRATLYIGKSFKNLSLKEEAQVFFSELFNNYPDSKEAKEARALLK